MNKKQKSVLIDGLIIISILLLFRFISGSAYFSKTRVLVDKQDELSGSTYKEWKNNFIPGFDLTLVVSFITLLRLLILTYIFRNKNKEIA